MLKVYKYNNLINFSAEVFMCEKHQSNNELSCWNLRLLVQGKLIDAYHWHSVNESRIHYREKDSVLVVGNWATKYKKRFQIIRAEVTSYLPANEDYFQQGNNHPLDAPKMSSIKVNREDN